MDAFKEYGVVPDVLDDAPPTKLEVYFFIKFNNLILI